MSGDRFCKDCRWVTWPWKHIRDSAGAMCLHPSLIQPANESLNPVTGRKRAEPPGSFCDMERRNGSCGPEGKHWEPADTTPVGFT